MYHATPWGKHVNEGVPEWPPSIWRLLRAIISVWKTTKPELSEQKVWPILQKLINELPEYHLPDASVSHTRHYVPVKDSNTLIMNTFVVMGKEKPIDIIWKNVTLNKEETETLDTILKNLHYFGRAESWCTVGTSTNSGSCNCSPLNEDHVSEDADLVSVLVPKKDVKFVDITEPATKSSKDEFNSISVTTKQLQDGNYVDPPGGRWVQYARPQNCFEGKLSHDTKTAYMDNVTLVRYAVVGTVRPSIVDTLRVGDMARNACMSKYGKRKNGDTSATFSGKDGDGNPLLGHMHAFYLPTYETQTQEIDHLTIIASKQFDKDELDVLFSLKRLYRRNTVDVHLVFQGCGMSDNFSEIPILQKSRIWVSATPVVLSRHIKYRREGSEIRQVHGPEEQIHGEIEKRYGASYALKNITIDQDQTNLHDTGYRPSDFFRWRRHGSVGDGKSYKVRLEFKEPVSGPITLGYSSHFGLGMFKPEEEI